MTERWIVNASPLILLGKASLLSLLYDQAGEVCVPAAVLREVGRGEEGTSLIAELQAHSAVRITTESTIPLDIAAWDLGDGESAVLAEALRAGGSHTVLDDLEARRCAKAFGLSVIGTLGIVARAKAVGLIPAAGPLIERLRGRGLYVSDELVRRTLDHLDELTG